MPLAAYKEARIKAWPCWYLYPTRPTGDAIAGNWHRIGTFVAVPTREICRPQEPLGSIDTRPSLGSHLLALRMPRRERSPSEGGDLLMAFLRIAVSGQQLWGHWRP